MRASHPCYPDEPGPRRAARRRRRVRRREGGRGPRERVDYRDEEEVDGVVTAGGSCKIKRRLLLC